MLPDLQHWRNACIFTLTLILYPITSNTDLTYGDHMQGSKLYLPNGWRERSFDAID
jgi:hypothetical protein